MDHLSPDILEAAAASVLSNSLASTVSTVHTLSEHEVRMQANGAVSEESTCLRSAMDIAEAIGSDIASVHPPTPSYSTPSIPSVPHRIPRPQEGVNQIQASRILQRRQCRVNLQAERAIRGYLGGQVKQVSRQDHARRRQRGPHGRFLGAEAKANLSSAEQAETSQGIPQEQQARRQPRSMRRASMDTPGYHHAAGFPSQRSSHAVSHGVQSMSSASPMPQQPAGGFAQPRLGPCPPLPQEMILRRQLGDTQQLRQAFSGHGVMPYTPQVNVSFESCAAATGSAFASAAAAPMAAPHMEFGVRPSTSQQHEVRKATLLKSMNVLSNMLMRHQLAYQQLEQESHQR